MTESSVSSLNAKPFSPDGGFRIEGLALLLGGMIAVGALLGYLAGIIGQYFYLILLFPIGIGLAIGFIGRKLIEWGRVRSPFLGGLAGLLGGLMAALVMQYHGYMEFQNSIKEIDPEFQEFIKQIPEMKAAGAELDPELQSIINELETSEDGQMLSRGLEIDNFWDYIDFSAQQSVSISRATSSSGGINLGYIGTYIYWIIELLIIAGLAFVMSKEAATKPFCTRCETWKQPEILGSFSSSIDKVSSALVAGDLDLLRQLNPHPSPSNLTATLASCEQCKTSSPVHVKLEHITQNSKGENKSKTVAHATYPGDSGPALKAIFYPVPSAPPENGETPSPAPSDSEED